MVIDIMIFFVIIHGTTMVQNLPIIWLPVDSLGGQCPNFQTDPNSGCQG